MSLDFSAKTDLVGLARLVRDLRIVADPQGVDFFLMGAVARDLMLSFAHGIDAGRRTEDADFGIMVADWSAFENLRRSLIAGGNFSERPGSATHRLRYRDGSHLDIVPFGGVERESRQLAWPPDGTTVFDCFGMSEAFGSSETVLLPENTQIKVSSLPALAVLKVCAWQDRKQSHPGRDAPDLLLLLRYYMDCGNFERAAAEHADLLVGDDFDYAEAGVRLLARDIATLVGVRGIERLTAIIAPEADENGHLLLARQSGVDIEHARRLLDVLCGELESLNG